MAVRVPEEGVLKVVAVLQEQPCLHVLLRGADAEDPGDSHLAKFDYGVQAMSGSRGLVP